MTEPGGGVGRQKRPLTQQPQETGKLQGHEVKVALWTKVPGLEKIYYFFFNYFGRNNFSSGSLEDQKVSRGEKRSREAVQKQKESPIPESSSKIRKGETKAEKTLREQVEKPLEEETSELRDLEKVLGKEDAFLDEVSQSSDIYQGRTHNEKNLDKLIDEFKEDGYGWVAPGATGLPDRALLEKELNSAEKMQDNRARFNKKIRIGSEVIKAEQQRLENIQKAYNALLKVAPANTIERFQFYVMTREKILERYDALNTRIDAFNLIIDVDVTENPYEPKKK